MRVTGSHEGIDAPRDTARAPFNERLVSLLSELQILWKHDFASDPTYDTAALLHMIRDVIWGLFDDTERNECVKLLVAELTHPSEFGTHIIDRVV